MANIALVVYVVVEKVDQCGIQAGRKLLQRYVSPGRSYIGLREHASDAIERATYWSAEAATSATHIGLKISFTAAGFAYFAMRSAGADHAYVPILNKQVYRDTSRDWKVWHFLGDLPLDIVDDHGEAMLVSEWVDLDDLR